jgi:RNA polymerase sigma-70 factor (ECF subfamily)
MVTPTQDVELGRLYETLGPELWRALFAFGRDREIANDAVAEAFVQYLRRRDEIRSPRAWLWKAAFRIASGELQRRGRTDPPSEEQAVVMELESLLDVLATLPDRQRAVTLLRYYAGYEPSEIAEILGMAASTVRVHLLRARRKLLTVLEDDDD